MATLKDVANFLAFQRAGLEGKMNKHSITTSFGLAKEIYAGYGVDVEDVLKKFDTIAISIPCWQGDDVGGFERHTGGATGGIMATGNYPGKPHTAEELRNDMDKAIQHIPGPVKINLHASYGEDYEPDVDRDEYGVRHFTRWVAWAKEHGISLDMNVTTFGHPKAASNLTISNPNDDIRHFWIRHMRAARRIAEYFGKEFNQPCVYNTWVQDGIKDMTPNKMLYRGLMKESFDEIWMNSGHYRSTRYGRCTANAKVSSRMRIGLKISKLMNKRLCLKDNIFDLHG